MLATGMDKHGEVSGGEMAHKGVDSGGRAPAGREHGMSDTSGGRKGGGEGSWAHSCPVGHGSLRGAPSPSPLLTGLRAAARVWAARAADVAAAAVRAALAPADAHQDEEEEDAQDHQPDKHPLWKDTQRNRVRMATRRRLPMKRQTGERGAGTEGTEPPNSGGTGRVRSADPPRAGA